MFEVPAPARAHNEGGSLGRTHLLEAKALQDVDSSTLAMLARAARLIAAQRPRDTEVCRNSSRYLFLILGGHAALCSHGKVVELPGVGELFGEEHVLGAVSANTVTLLGHATALAIPASAVRSALDDSPGLARALLLNLSRRSLSVMERMQWYANRRALERLAAFLMQKLPASDGPCDVKLPASKTIIASLLSMSKESLSRCLAQLANQAGITRGGSVVHVPVPWRLAEVCRRGGDCADCGRCRHAERWLAGSRAA